MSPEEMWTAVCARDAGYDPLLVYAVTSTGIYCRPSCGARRPRRDRVRFFAGPAEAERCGFRACKRCHPDRDGSVERDPKAAVAAAHIEAHADETLALSALAREVGLSPGHLQRVFTRAYGLSPRRYQEQLRGEEMRRRLRAGESVAQAGYGAGFGSGRGMYAHAQRSMGMTPAAYRRGGAGLTIRYGVGASALGAVLVGATGRGVCCVLLGDDDAEVVRALEQEFPRADLLRDDAGVREWTEEVVARVAGHAPDAQVPLDLAGTDFQRRVWAALQRVPLGSTISYGALAGQMGAPRAARAVASACAGNHAAILVPCHRVVRADGALGGYRWGVERKSALIEREALADRTDAG